ncbi:hypothetical protein ABFX02_13G064300 [Erythranthe guttata]
MDSVKRSALTPTKSRLASTFAKVFRNQSGKGIISPDSGIKKTKSHEKTKKDRTEIPSSGNEEDKELQNQAVREAFLSKLFAGISTIKSAYAQLQFAQSPYDSDGIQAADQTVVAELTNLSELKQCYFKKQLDDEKSPETTLLLSEIQEQSSLLKTYEITTKKLDSQLMLKDSEITFLKEKLAEADKENKTLGKKLNASGPLFIPDNIRLLSDLKPSHFNAYLRTALKSIRSFVKLMISEMESADWDLDAAASAIEPGVSFWKPNHKCFAFESFVCKHMFDGFNYRNEGQEEKSRAVFFETFTEMTKYPGPASGYLAKKPKSEFARFCREKYSRLVHPKMEESIFGNLNQRDLVGSGDFFPETSFFSAFSEMAKRVWVLRCMALSFDREVSVYQVKKGSRFSEVYMESLSDEAFLFSDKDAPENDPRVAFTVVPGFRVGEIIIQCQVYLC